MQELNQIRGELALMAARVGEDLGKAISILRTGDKALAQEVRESGKIVDALHIKIEELVFVLIATKRPVARDLRELLTITKISASMERVGDYGIHLVKSAEKLSRQPAFRSAERIERMALTGQKMLKAAFSAYMAQDGGAARKAAAMDDDIDSEHKAITEEMLKLMKKKPELVKTAARLLRLSGYMERLGDHITNMCEGIIFMTEGTHEELNK